MKTWIAKLWKDDTGALIAAEYLFVVTILVIGIIVGLASLREAVVVELSETANALLALSQGFSISGLQADGVFIDGSEAIDNPGSIGDPTFIPASNPIDIDIPTP